MPQADVDLLETTDPGFIAAALEIQWDKIKGRLRKRYDVAVMQANPPEVVLGWLTDIVTPKAYAKRGNNPAAASDLKDIYEAGELALAEIKEAADSKEGLFDLPLAKTTDASGVSRGGPLGYAETSPYVWTTNQREDAEENG